MIELIENVENAENVENDDDDDGGGDGENSMPVNVDRPNTNTPLAAGNVNAGAVGGAKTNREGPPGWAEHPLRTSGFEIKLNGE